MSELADAELEALYLRLYFDEDVSVDIVNNLQMRGFDLAQNRLRKLPG